MNELTFAVEHYFNVIGEMSTYFEEHASALATHPDMHLNPDYDAYTALAKEGSLHVVTARNFSGLLVGYHVSMLSTHFHYRDSLTAHVDVYYLRPDSRKGWAGVRFLRFVDESLRRKGVDRVYTTTTLREDKGALLKALGYEEVERLYVKKLGGRHE